MSAAQTDVPSAFRPDLLTGQVALVTGGGSGICLGIAQALGRHGARLMLVSRNAERLAAACKDLQTQGLEVAWHAADVRDPTAVQAALDACAATFGGLNILVNGAAGNFLCPAADLSPNGFKTVVDIDLLGTFNMSRLAFPLLCAAAPKACILNVSATLHYSGTPLMTHAVAAKAGVDALTRNLATEWGPLGVRVNGVAPGPIDDTEGMARLLPASMKESLRNRIPMRRMGTVQDVGNAALFLVGPAASYVTGATLVVDGAAWITGRLSVDELTRA